MSIWISVGEPVRGLNGHADDANYRAEGEPTAGVDVAVTDYRDHVRLSVWDDAEAAEMEVILSPAAARAVRDQLSQAAAR